MAEPVRLEGKLIRDGAGFLLRAGRNDWPLLLTRTPVDLVERRVMVEGKESGGRIEVHAIRAA